MVKIFRFWLLNFIIVFGFSIGSFAQVKKITGVVKDSLSLITIPSASIYNQTKKQKVIADDDGNFAIEASPSDYISVSAVGYELGGFYYRGATYTSDTVEIWLKPKISQNLPGVVTYAYAYKDYQLDSAGRRADFLQDIGMKKSLFESSNSGAGIGISLDNIFSKGEKRKREAYKNFLAEEDNKYVDFRFNPTTVHSYSGLKGSRLKSFMQKYRPSYQWLRNNLSAEDLKYYINSKLNLFFNGKPMPGPDGTQKVQAEEN